MITLETTERIEELVIDALAKSFIKHGHFMTGKLIDEIDVKVEPTSEGQNIDFYIYPYGAYLERGVKASNIPFSPGSGAGHSLYIEGLMSYVKRRMNISDSKKALSIAFAIAHTQKLRGMPIRTGGEGTGWISKAIDDSYEKFRKTLEEDHYRAIEVDIENIIKKFKI